HDEPVDVAQQPAHLLGAPRDIGNANGLIGLRLCPRRRRDLRWSGARGCPLRRSGTRLARRREGAAEDEQTEQDRGSPHQGRSFNRIKVRRIGPWSYGTSVLPRATIRLIAYHQGPTVGRSPVLYTARSVITVEKTIDRGVRCRFNGGVTTMRTWTLLLSLSWLLASPSWGADLDGVLKKIKGSGTITLGYRDSSRPFSFSADDGKLAGYSVDLCQRVAESLKKQLGLQTLDIKWVKTTVDNRMQLVSTGGVDIECGSTTMSLSRQEQVDFSLMTFLDGGSLLVTDASGI